MLASAAAAQETRPTIGLDALSDDRLISELAGRGLSALLERAFDVNAVPEARRSAIRSLVALQQLAAGQLSAPQRRALVRQTIAGIEQALGTMDEPQTMMQQASMLIRYGIERDVNTLEYWGENAKTQSELRPVVEAVIRLLERVEALAKKLSQELSEKLVGPNDPRTRTWEEMTGLVDSSAYTRNMIAYDLALAIPTADPQRRKVAEAARDYLKQFDNAESGVQPIVRNRIAKLQMAAGDLDEAQKSFATIVDAKEIHPPPDVSQQYEARYFSAVCDVLAKRLAQATTKLQELSEWQKAHLPPEKQAREGAEAATAMLEYRVRLLQAQATTDPAGHARAEDEARDVLLALVRRRPDLRVVVFEQLLTRLDVAANLKSLDPLLLEAIIQRGDTERLKPTGEPFDAAAIEQAIAAARQLLARKGQPNVEPESLESAAILVPLFLEKLGRNIEATDGFLDYLKDFGATAEHSGLALEAAQSLIARLRADPKHADDPPALRVYERFLPVALAKPFNRTEFAFEYARLLQKQGKLKQAVAVFAQVPPADPRLAHARFYQMVAVHQRLDDEPLAGAARQEVVSEFRGLAKHVSDLAQAAMAQAADKDRWRGILARTALLSADVARREENNPEQTLELLTNVEDLAKGLTAESDLLASALYMRVQAYMSLGQHDEATACLVKLLAARSGGEGASIVYTLMQKLNEDFELARKDGNAERMRLVARNRARLSGFLVEWAKNNADENIRRYAYRYSVFDAATKQLAAGLEDDSTARESALRQALTLYRNLESPDNVALYRATLEDKSADAKYPDPQVQLGVGLISYDLADYAEAQRRLGQLLVDRKLGSPVSVIEENGIERTLDNEQYWEATIKLLKSNVELARKDASASGREQSAQYLKELCIRWGAQVGGKRWHEQFEQLRAELIPTFKY